MFNWPLGTKPTQALSVLILTGVLIGVGIVRTHNNLMYLVFSILLVSTLAGWIIPAVFSRTLRVKRTLPPAGHVGTEISIEVQVQNKGRLFSTPLVAIEGPPLRGGEYTNGLEGAPALPILVGVLVPGSTVQFQVPLKLTRRGILRLHNVRMISAFPMGLFEREWATPDETQMLVYPRIVSIRDRLLEGMAVNLSRASSTPDTEREIQSLRGYQDGDDIRRINWKATARRDLLVVGEHHRIEKRAKVSLYLDISGENDDNREAAISMIASLASFYHARNRLIELVTAREIISFGRSDRKMKAMLRLLALLGDEDQIPLNRRPPERSVSLKVLVHAGRMPRCGSRCDLVIGPNEFGRYAPALNRGRPKVHG